MDTPPAALFRVTLTIASGLGPMQTAAAAAETAGHCELASKDYSPGALVVDDGVAIRCGEDGSWTLAGQTLLCHYEGRSYSPGALLRALRDAGPMQICTDGTWTAVPNPAVQKKADILLPADL